MNEHKSDHLEFDGILDLPRQSNVFHRFWILVVLQWKYLQKEREIKQRVLRDFAAMFIHRFLVAELIFFKSIRSEIPPCTTINFAFPASTYEYNGSQLNISLNRSSKCPFRF